MQQLYNELVNGSVEFKDNGVIIQHPPTALALRAARTIKQLSEINQGNENVLMQTQFHNQQLIDQVNELQRQLSTLQTLHSSDVQPNRVEDNNNVAIPIQDVREDQGQNGTMECSSEQSSGSDSNSQGCGTIETNSTGVN